MNDNNAHGGNPSAQPRTSLTDPLRIAEIQPVGFTGWVGVTICPGKQGDSVYGRPWLRDLRVDLDAIEAWGARAVITLIEEREFETLGVIDLGARIRARGIAWLHLPIVDLQPPGMSFEAEWPSAAARIRDWVSGGERVLVHCRGGQGRAGTVAACILIELGAAPSEAMTLVRKVRPRAIETRGQERYVLKFKATTGNGPRI